MTTRRISLAEAALRLRLTYHQVRALVLRGALHGGRDDLGRFYVERQGIRQFERRRARKSASHAR